MKELKQKRQDRLLSLIEDNPISTQGELVEALQNEGFNITQATISRDIKELNLIKTIDDKGNMRYKRPKQLPSFELRRLAKLLNQSFKYCDQQDNMLVLYTLPGSAPAVSNLLMKVYRDDLFTIMSNDDHLLMIGRDVERVLEIKKEIEALLENGGGDYTVTSFIHS